MLTESSRKASTIELLSSESQVPTSTSNGVSGRIDA